MPRPFVLGMLVLFACDGDKEGGGGNGNGGGGLEDLEPVDSDQDGTFSDTDCNDADAAIFPGASEACNGLDDDCNGTVDDDLAVTWYRDADGDTYGDPEVSAVACSQPNGFVTNDSDCDDGNRIVQPGGVEVCDLAGLDENCNGAINEDDAGVENLQIWYVDADEDGYGTSKTVEACFEAPGLATVGTDCNDADFDINPGTPEVCDALDKDEDCDGFSDVDDLEGPLGQPLYYIDVDGDDNGDMSDPGQYFCDGVPPGYSTLGTDCDDENAIINPQAPENCRDLIDNDCNGAVDDCGPISDIPVDTADVTIEGEFSNGYFGMSLAGLGDINGDGSGDFAVGAPYADSYKGVVSMFQGPLADTGTFAADDLYTATLTGTVMYGQFAWSLDAAGDVNADGFDDIVVGMQSYDKGKAYLFLGPFAGDSTADSADGTWSAEEYGDYAAKAVAGNFDFDADGASDYAIGSYYADSDTTADVGAAYLVYGPGTGAETSLADAPLKITGSGSSYTYFADGLTGVTDMNGDGADELAVGAWQDASYYGAAYVFNGGSLSGEIDASLADATITGAGSSQYFGRYLSRVNDFNNDGYGDLAVEAPYAHSYYGSVYVFLGPASSGNADTIAHAELYGEYSYAFNTYSGGGLDGSGDVNSDEYSDVLIGAPQWSTGGLYSVGVGYLVYGPQTGDVSLANARCAFPGTASNDQAGADMAFIGDQTGDESPEVLIGGPYSAAYYGSAWMVFGDRL